MKEAKTVEVKMLVPWGIIAAIALVGAAFIAGFHVSQRYQEGVKADAVEMVTSLSKKESK